MAAAVGAIRQAGASPAEEGWEGMLGSAAFAVALGAPSVIAFLAPRRSLRLLIGAGTVLFLMAFALSIATWPLLIPAAIFVAMGAGSRGGNRGLLVGIGAALLIAGAMIALFVSQDPRSWSLPSESGSTSDVVSYAEASISLALSASAILLVAVGGRDRRRRVFPESSRPVPG